MAVDAPPTAAGVAEQLDGSGAAQDRDRVQRPEAPPSEGPLELGAEHQQREHVERQVQGAHVHERRRDHPPGVAELDQHRHLGQGVPDRRGVVVERIVADSPADTAVTTNSSTFTAIRPIVTGPQRRAAERSPPVRLGARTLERPSRTHSGHWKPTAAGVMHSGQIGRPQRAQLMPVERSAWR